MEAGVGEGGWVGEGGCGVWRWGSMGGGRSEPALFLPDLVFSPRICLSSVSVINFSCKTARFSMGTLTSTVFGAI